MAGVAQGARIRSTDVCAIMRRINALEGRTFTKGSAKTSGILVITPGGEAGYLHVQNTATDFQIIDLATDAVIATYDLEGFGGDHFENWGDWGPNGDLWTFGATKDTTPDPDEWNISLNRYNGATGEFIERIDLSVIDQDELRSGLLPPVVGVGGEGGTKIWVDFTSSLGEDIFRHTLSGTRDKQIDTWPDYSGRTFKASKQTSNNFSFQNSSGLDPLLTRHEFNSSGAHLSNTDVHLRSPGPIHQADNGEWMQVLVPGEDVEFVDSAGLEIETITISDVVDSGDDFITGRSEQFNWADGTRRHPDGADAKIFAVGFLLSGGSTTKVAVFSEDGTLDRMVSLFNRPSSPISQTTFYKYPTTSLDDRVSLGTPDNGVSIPALTALEGIIPRSNEVTDMHSAVEAVLVHYKNSANGAPWNFDGVQLRAINDATNASPIVITTEGAHGYPTGYGVEVAGVLGNTAANGSWAITSLTSTTFSLDGSTGNGTYSSGVDASANGNNLYEVAVEDGVFDWTETGAYKTIIREDLIDHLDLCLTKLETSASA